MLCITCIDKTEGDVQGGIGVIQYLHLLEGSYQSVRYTRAYHLQRIYANLILLPAREVCNSKAFGVYKMKMSIDNN